MFRFVSFFYYSVSGLVLINAWLVYFILVWKIDCEVQEMRGNRGEYSRDSCCLCLDLWGLLCLEVQYCNINNLLIRFVLHSWQIEFSAIASDAFGTMLVQLMFG